MSEQRFKGKVAVVTGGNSGIGLATAKAYSREGASVVITGRDEKTLQAAAKEIGPNTLAIRSDAGKLADIDNAIAAIHKRFDKIDALFVNAGIAKFVSLDEISEELFNEIFSVNVKGVLFTIQKALPLMKPGSAIVLMASVARYKAFVNAAVYGASKAAILNMTKNLALTLVDRGIRVNSVSPGPIDTPILSRGVSADQAQQMRDWITSLVPMKHLGQPEDIAAAVLYLTSPESGFVTGSDLIIDGGTATLS